MQHPFQRSETGKQPVSTPFQRELVGILESYGAGKERISGRQLSRKLGKSANHLSQMLNDGLVPSGQTILEMCRILDLDEDTRDGLIRAAMETKAQQRSRDNFWINHTTRMLHKLEEQLRLHRAFLEQGSLKASFERFLRQQQGGRGEGRELESPAQE